MGKRMTWLVVSGLMVLSLVVTSCAPKVTEEEEVVTEKGVTEKGVTEKGVVTEKEVVAKKEVPQYGGVLSAVDFTDPDRGFDNTGLYRGAGNWQTRLSNQSLLEKDRLKGPGGSGEWDGLADAIPLYAHMTGKLAESWEVVQPDTLIFHIRKGIHWQDKPPTNGMELTAEDVVYSYVLGYERPGSVWPINYPYFGNMKNMKESIYVDPNDPWAVVMKTAPGQLTALFEYVAVMSWIMPKALGDIKGDGFVDWRGVVGTGAFILTDYVRGSSLTWKRNPNYWQKDPLHPENQLPYLDGMKMFIIPDLSTQYAALRTGKLDLIAMPAGVAAEDAESLIRTNPELRWQERLSESLALYMRHDKAPWGDVRVRRAMQMAIDLDEMVKDLYEGKAEKFWWPGWPRIPEHVDFYRPIEQMPESVQELYTYHPDKAKQLLKEAGYPDGFSTSIIVSAAREAHIDLLSIVKAYWAKVGVTLKIDVREEAVFNAMNRAKSYEAGQFRSIPVNSATWFLDSRAEQNYLLATIPLVEATMAAVHANYFDWAERVRILIEATPKLHDLALHIKLPTTLVYSVWQPWLKGYHGQLFPGARMSPAYPPVDYVWIDQELKKSMGR